MSEPRRILTGDPLTAFAGSTLDDSLELVRVEADGLRVLHALASVAHDAFFSATDDSLVLASQALGFEGSRDGLMPGHENARVLAYGFTLPED